MKLDQPIKYNKNPITSNRKLKKFGSNLFNSLIIPVIMIVLAEILVRVFNHESIFVGKNTHATLINVFSIAKTSVLVLIAALALNTNLNSGRMDFALGATGILAVVLTSLIIPDFETPEHILAFLFIAMLIGMIIGLFHSAILCFTKLPPIVISLGMCLVYEGIAYVIAGKTYGSTQITIPAGGNAAFFFMEPIILVPILVVVCLLMSAALCYTRFGYNKLALVYNQKISVDTGINEFLHCVVSFAIAGALIALYQVINSCGKALTISTGLASSGDVFKNFLPIFIGGLIAKHNNQIIGLLLAVIGTTVLYTYGFGTILPSTYSSLLNGFSVFAVLVYMVDAYKVQSWIKMRKYIRKEKYLNPQPKGDK